ncbi:MAG TPA: YCF48-related protein [Parafilimonas sp.]|nr:YCF48-related protein [Parafilimonas sp.]
MPLKNILILLMAGMYSCKTHFNEIDQHNVSIPEFRLEPELSTAGNNLDAICAKGNELWAVGKDSIVHYNGKQWESQASGNANNLHAIYALGDEIWAVGGKGTIIHYNGTQWESQESTTESGLEAICGQGDEIWAVGGKGTIVHYNGKQWESQNSTTQRRLQAICAKGGELWAVGMGIIVHYDGKQWESETSIPESLLEAVYGKGDELWVVGHHGVVLHYNGEQWEQQTSTTQSNLYAIYGRGNEIWAVGDNGTIVHYDGKQWQPQTSVIQNRLTAIYENGDGLWAVGGAVLYSKDKNNWALIDEHDSKFLCTNNNVTWAGGRNGLRRIINTGKYLPALAQINYETSTLNPYQIKVRLRFDSSISKEFNAQSGLSFEGLKKSDTGTTFKKITSVIKTANDHSFETEIDTKQFGIDYESDVYNKLRLRLSFNYKGVVQHFDLKNSSTEPYLIIKNDFLQKHATPVMVAMIIVAYYMILVLFYLFFPLQFLNVYKKFPLNKIIERLPNPFNSVFIFLNILFPLSVLAYGKKTLNKWVEKNSQFISDKVLSTGLSVSRREYISVPVEINDQTITEKPGRDLLPEILNKRRNIIQIIGEGGSGKTTLAIQLCKWITQNKALIKSNKFPFIIDYDTHDVVKSIKEKINAWLPDENIEDDFVKALLKNQNIVLLVDALSELDVNTQNYVDTIHSNVPANLLIITSRKRFSFQQLECAIIKPLPLTSDKLLYFLISYFNTKKETVAANLHQEMSAFPLKTMEEQLAFAGRIGVLFSNAVNAVSVTPILVKIIIDNFFKKFQQGNRSFTDLMEDMPKSIPEVYYEYLENVNPKNKTVTNYLDTDIMFQLAELMGCLSLGNNFIPQDFSQQSYTEAVNKRFKDVNAVSTIQRFSDNGIITRKNNLGSFFLRFNLDPLAEYVAAAYYYKLHKDAKTVDQFILKVSTMSDDSKGFKTAFTQIAEHFNQR